MVADKGSYHMKFNNLRLSRFVAAAGLSLVALVSVGRSQLTFTIDTFTTDQLTITLNPSTVTGTSFTDYQYLTIMGEVNGNYGSTYLPSFSWISSNSTSTVETAPGSIGAVNFVTGGSPASFAQASTSSGPEIFIYADDPITSGSSITSPYQITFSGTGIFDPSQVTALRLSWGEQFAGVFQSSTSTSAVPEPGTYAAIFGAVALIGTVVVRRRPGR
jgi:hypothetical protein